MSGLLDSVIGAATSKLSGPLGERLGESPEAIKKGVEVGSATILGGMAKKADDPGIVGKIFNMATGAETTGAAASEGPSPASAGDTGSGLLSTLFGSQSSSIVDTIGRVAGLKSSSATGLMAALVPTVLGSIGSHIRTSGLNASGFANMLKAEVPSISRVLPAGLNFASQARSAAQPAMAEAVRAGKKASWLWPAVVAAVLIIGGLVWWASHSHKTNEEPVAATPTAAEKAPGAAYVGELIKRKLPNGTELSIPRDGVETRVIDSMESGSIDNTKWFVLDRLVFDEDSATLQSASQEQLTSVANILKAFPNTHVKVGGYTDNAGDAAHDLKLSQERADAVMVELVKKGVPADQVEAKGYGQENPVADNATEAGRQQNRRVSIQLASR